MRARGVLAFAVSLVLAVAVLAQGAEGKKKSAPKAAASPVVMPAGDLKWTDLDPQGAPGVKIADLWGDHTKGAFGAFLKFPAGFAAPLHTHTNAVKIVVVSGTFTQAPEGKPEFRLGPGSYLMQPGGSYKHTTGCDPASECVFFAESTGKFDLKPVEKAMPEPVREMATPRPAPAVSAPIAAAPAAGASKVTDPGGPIAVAATKAGLRHIGAEKCKLCHKVQFASWAETAHAKRTPPLECESCHGAGSEYKSLDVMKSPAKARAAGMVIPTVAFCANCHKSGWKDEMLRKAHEHKTVAAAHS
jgi:hypothetical protein